MMVPGGHVTQMGRGVVVDGAVVVGRGLVGARISLVQSWTTAMEEGPRKVTILVVVPVKPVRQGGKVAVSLPAAVAVMI